MRVVGKGDGTQPENGGSRLAKETRPQDADICRQDATGCLQPYGAIVDALGTRHISAEIRQITRIDEMEGLGQYIGHIIDSTGMSAVERGRCAV